MNGQVIREIERKGDKRVQMWYLASTLSESKRD